MNNIATKGDTPSPELLQKYVLTMVWLNAFATAMILSASHVALPSIVEDLQLNVVVASWVPMLYLIASAMFVIIFGRLADMFGRKRIFLLGTLSFIITSILVAMAQNAPFLLTARFLQGISAAMLYATQIAIVSAVFPPKKRGHVIGLTVSAIYFGLTFGPVLGGVMVDLYGWRASYLIHIPLTCIVLWIGCCKVDAEWSASERGSFDIKGAILYSTAILLLCLGVASLPKLYGVIFLLLGLGVCYSFIRLEKGLSHPIFNIMLFFKNRAFAFSCYASLVIYTSTFANIFLISLYLQYCKTLSATLAGCIIMIQPFTMAVFSPWMGNLSDRIEPKKLASIGMLCTALGLLALGMLDGNTSISYLVIALMITGLGFSLFSSPNANVIMSTVEKGNYGSASSSLAVMRILGQMMSMVLVTLVFSTLIGPIQIEGSMYNKLQYAINSCFIISSILCIFGAYLSLGRGRIHHAV